MSKPNLPPLPPGIKEIAWFGKTPQDVYGRAEMIAYAEEAVRQALAELVPVGCCMATANGHLHTFSSMRAADEVEQRARDLKQKMFFLCMLPETSPGHKPAPVDTSCGHSAPIDEKWCTDPAGGSCATCGTRPGLPCPKVGFSVDDKVQPLGYVAEWCSTNKHDGRISVCSRSRITTKHQAELTAKQWADRSPQWGPMRVTAVYVAPIIPETRDG